MKKFISGVLLGAILCMCIGVYAADVKFTAIKSAFTVLVKGKQANQVKPLVTINGEYYISAKQVADAFGVKFNVNSKVKRIELGETKTNYKLLALIDYLKSKGFTIGETEDKAFEMIGAASGFSVKINDSVVELYAFDLNSTNDLSVKNINNAVKSSSIEILGTQIPVKMNNNLIITNFEEHPDKDKLLKAFMDFK